MAKRTPRKPRTSAPRTPYQERAEKEEDMLTTGQCARWMGSKTSYVVAEIREGYLKANNLGKMDHRADYRIWFPYFVAYLHARRWSRIPQDPKELT